ncbi:hypothetical protein [Actinosynnema sp. NPDC020468]|uniref:hypothetical protein n=1 Tax=Actinosynnema sp. NPDC020468 TaxID=3154488 RepID=UPI0034102FB4
MMRTQDFPVIAARLRHAATTFERWSTHVQAVADNPPTSVPPMIVKGVPRPVEAEVIARADQGMTADLRVVRASVIQAVLHAERAVETADRVVNEYSGTRRPAGSSA